MTPLVQKTESILQHVTNPSIVADFVNESSKAWTMLS